VFWCSNVRSITTLCNYCNIYSTERWEQYLTAREEGDRTVGCEVLSDRMPLKATILRCDACTHSSIEVVLSLLVIWL
jgi:hypothetical protein